MSIFVLLRVAYVGCLALTCYIGFTRGGRSERIATAIVLVASLLTIIVESPMPFSWHDRREGLIAVDVLVLVAFLYLALRSRRFWPLWVTAFQLIAVCTHLVIAPAPHPYRLLQAYAILQGFWAYPIMISIMVGSLSRAARRSARRRQNGANHA